jgi:hypothetical protein
MEWLCIFIYKLLIYELHNNVLLKWLLINIMKSN